MPRASMIDPFDDADRVSKFSDCCVARSAADTTAELYSALVGWTSRPSDFLHRSV